MAVILLVEDDADYRAAVGKFLARRGHQVYAAPNGHEALAVLTSTLPDVVILDAIMPQMDGTSFIEVVRSYLRWQSLPVIMLTAYPEGDHVRRAMAMGVKKTFAKGELELEALAAYVDALASPLGPVPGQGPGKFIQ